MSTRSAEMVMGISDPMRSSSESDTSSKEGLCRFFLGALLACLAFAPAPVGAKVFLSQQEAIEVAFPGADRVEEKTTILSAGQKKAIEKLSRSRLEGELLTVFTGWKGEELLGYAQIDVHQVRTLPEGFMTVLSPTGEVTTAQVLAFYEPLEYLPSDRWFRQFLGVSKENELRLGYDIHGVSGATISARVMTECVRRFLAIYQVLIEPARAEKPAP